MKKGFLKGFLVGFCFTFLLVSFIILMIINGDKVVFFNKSVQNADAKAKLETLLNYVEMYYDGDYDTGDLYEEAYHGLISGLGDRYSAYYTKEEYEKLAEKTNGSYVGIGASVTYSEDGDYVQVVAPTSGGPAESAGIRAGDIIVAVDGVSTYKTELDKVTSMMKGAEGTGVVITVKRDNENIDFNVIRQKIETMTVKHEMLEDSIGYVAVSSFDRVTSGQFNDAVGELEGQGMKGLIIDLRGNGGGLLFTSTSMLDRILPKDKLLVYTLDKNGKKEEEYSNDDDKVDVPIVIIMNGGSASASEVFAGCLRDYGVAEIVGELSFGKGIVQTMFTLGDGSRLKLTTSSYYSPKGINIHGKGISPDVEVLDDPDTETDEQLVAAIGELKKKVS